MFLAHSFRLRDPWKCEATEDGATRWSRLFHRPTGLEPDDELVLVISGLPPNATVTVNGQRLPRGRESFATSGVDVLADSPVAKDSRPLPFPHQYNVTHLLTDSNQIEIQTPIPHSSLPTPASFPYDARLAIIAHS